MNDFDVIATTVRNGIAVDAVEFAVDGAPPATAYRLGEAPGRLQPVAMAFHHERGDKATLLSELKILASKGFLCLSVDSPTTRLGIINRNPLEAFEAMLTIGQTALNLVRTEPGVLESAIALMGRGIGGEVAARLAAVDHHVRVAVAIAALPRRSNFTASSDHALAAGLRRFHDPATSARLINGLAPHDLVTQLRASPETSWLLQLAQDDDRLDTTDHQTLAMSIPRAVTVATHRSMSDLRESRARRERLDFITRLCR